MADSKLNKSDKRSNLAKQGNARPQTIDKSELSGKSVSPLLSPLALVALGLAGAAVAEAPNKKASGESNSAEGKPTDLIPAKVASEQADLVNDILTGAGNSDVANELQALVQNMNIAVQAVASAPTSEASVSQEQTDSAATELSDTGLMAAASSTSTAPSFSDSNASELPGYNSPAVILAQASTTATSPATATTATSSGTEASAAVGAEGVSGLSVLGILAGIAVAAGGSGSSGPTGDVTAPVITSMTAKIGTSVITLTYNEALDATKTPPTNAFTISTGGASNAVTSVTISGNVVTLNLANQITAGNVSVAYTDPTSSNDVNAIQDTAGNDAVTFLQGKLADGYIRGAQIYIDTNKDGKADASEALSGVVTDADGNFFLPSSAPKGTIIAVGGVNIDTGVPNTIPLKAPEGSTTINPLTTLVQAVVENSSLPGATLLTAAQASAKVAEALGLTLPTGASLTSYDPLSATDSGALVTQQASAQIATLVTLAATNNATTANAVQSKLATLVSASSSPGGLDLTSQATIQSAVTVSGVTPSQSLINAISLANNDIDQAQNLNDIASKQAAALDNIAPATPTLTVAALGNVATPAVKVTLNTSALDGSAVVTGDTVQVYEGNTPVSTAQTITAADLVAGFITINTSTLAEGSHTLNARITDKGDNTSAVGTAAGTTATAVIDLTAPRASNITASSDDTGASATDRITKDSTQTLSISAEAGSTVKVYDGQTLLGTATETQGVFSFTTAALSDGVHVLSAKATDPAGNTGTAGTTYSVTIDTAAPTASTLSPADGGKSLGLNADLVLTANQDIAKGTGNITLYKADNTVVETFAVSSDKVTVSGSAITINPSAALVKEQDYYVKVDAGAFTDLAGNAFAGISDATTWNFSAAGATIATNDIAGNNIINAAELAAGVQVSGTVTAEFKTGTLTVQLQPSTGAAIDLENVVYDASTGAWTADVPKSLQGTASYTLNTTFTGSGSALGIAGTGQKSVQLDTVAPAQATLSLATDSGSANDKITNVGTVNISGLESTGTWQYSTNGGTAWTNGSGSSVTLTGDGDKSIIVKQTDAAGNVSSTSSALNFKLDTIAPDKGNIVQISENTGYSTTDRLTSDTTPIITLAAETGHKIILSTPTEPVAESNYSVSEDNGLYTVTVSNALADGGYGLVVVDAAGNYNTLKSDGSDLATFLIDKTPPTSPTITAISTDSGALGDRITNDNTPTLTVTTEAGIKLRLGQNGTEVSNAYTAVESTPGTYTVTVTGELADGSYGFAAFDGAGNKSTLVTASNFKIDTTKPNQPVITALSVDSGTAGDRLTNSTPVLTVNAEAGAKIVVSQASNVEGGGAVEITTPYTVEETTAGVYSVTFSSALADGSYGLVAIDKADNSSLTPTNLQSTATFAIDKVAPTLSVKLLDNTNVRTFEFAFSEAVQGFNASDVIVEHGTKGTFTVVDNKTYRVEVQLEASTEPVLLKVNANAGAGQDAFGNDSTAPSQAFTYLTLVGTTGADVLTNNNAAETQIDLSQGGSDTIKLTSASHATLAALDDVYGFGSDDKLDLSAILKTAGYASLSGGSATSPLVFKNVAIADGIDKSVDQDGSLIVNHVATAEIWSNTSANFQSSKGIKLDFKTNDSVKDYWVVANSGIAVPEAKDVYSASGLAGMTNTSPFLANKLLGTVYFELKSDATSFTFALDALQISTDATNWLDKAVPLFVSTDSAAKSLSVVTDTGSLTTVIDNQLHMLVKYVQATDTTELRIQYDTNSATGTGNTTVSDVIALDFSGDVTTHLTPAALTFI